MDRTLLWLRAETKPFEHRTLVTPEAAVKLIAAGFELVVERSSARIFPDADYQKAGCRLAQAGEWQRSPSHAIILGLKELDPALGPFTRRHVHFAHVYKDQAGWRDTLSGFARGGGTLYDLEYLVDDQGRRVAAFGYWAGFVGAALAVLAYTGQLQRKYPAIGKLQAWPDRDALVATVRDQLALTGLQGKTLPDSRPIALVIGALGRCGRGACEMLAACDLPVTAWDLEQTASGGPFDVLLDHQLLVNCVFVDSPNPPFTTLQHLGTEGRKLSVISDVSCDPFGDFNPLPIYQQCTSMDNPVERLMQPTRSSGALDLIAIDHLPSLLPRESSDDFATQMLPSLLKLDNLEQGVWKRAEAVFQHHRARL